MSLLADFATPVSAIRIDESDMIFRQDDYHGYLIRQFVPSSSQDAYDAIRSSNFELAKFPSTISNFTIGRFRMLV